MPPRNGVHMEGDPDPIAVQAAMERAAVRTMVKATLAVEAAIKERAPYRTGELRRSITSRVLPMGNLVIGEVGTNLVYARYLEQGTGLYGPHNQRIVPKNAAALRFPAGGTPSLYGMGAGGYQRQSGSGGPGFRLSGQQRAGSAGNAAGWVFARSVRGIRPRRFFEDGVLVASPEVASIFRSAGQDLSYEMHIARRRGLL